MDQHGDHRRFKFAVSLLKILVFAIENHDVGIAEIRPQLRKRLDKIKIPSSSSLHLQLALVL
jgi:hypothetical protein